VEEDAIIIERISFLQLELATGVVVEPVGRKRLPEVN
jgi:hypothetical protein